MANPFNPGAGRKPPLLAGREDTKRSIRADMQRVYRDGEGARPVIVSGLRGMGKTVFLRELADEARQQDWVVVWVEASPGESLAKQLAQATYMELRRMRNQTAPMSSAFEHALSVLKSFHLRVDPTGAYSFGIDVEPAKGYADTGDLAVDLGDLLEALGNAAREAGVAVLLAIDELQEASKEDLAALNVALHAIGQGAAPVPVYFVGAGLPTLPSVLADATSYAERMYRYFTLDLLEADAVRSAYVEPTQKEHVTWEDDALQMAMVAAGGYPYFIQQCGFCICEQVEGGSTITEVETIAGIELAWDELERGLYRSRWDRSTPKGKEMMRAMAQADAPMSLAELAALMGKRGASDLSTLRERLIKDGLIYAPERGLLDFTVPRMREFIRRAD